ncbi:anthranilate synthase component I family protein [Paenibacillus aurantiacus]|uniref:Anthranilate synthase component I family protein n=1 Tax=Paenibacillus aurantiacus TaxID=1936118 RepID=A0ABV5KPC4_9BACL
MNKIDVRTEIAELPYREPFDTYLALRRKFGQEELYILESLSGPAKDAQSTFIGFGPVFSVALSGTRVAFQGAAAVIKLVAGRAEAAGLLARREDGFHLSGRKELWNLLRHIQGQFNVDVPSPGEAFHFGFFGYMGYDTAWAVEDLPYRIPAAGQTPDIVLAIYQGLIEYNVVKRSARLVLNQAPGAWDDLPAETVLAALGEADDMNAAMPQEPEPMPAPHGIAYTMERSRYEDNVRQALAYISVGDIYQVQLGNQIHIQSDVSPLAVYQRLRERNPSPYMYLASFGEMTLVGASPELFLRLAGGEISMRPIAGTCKRGADERENERLVAALLADEKELAEHIMLVDLCRNDIGRVCSFGTLEVDELLAVEKYSHLNHLVSSVVGKRDPGKDMYEIIAATFPAGTMTGAPKVRAMEIIEELETTRRGPYAGALGFIDFSGYVNMALCIRTAVHTADGRYSVRASAGVVADSKPENEWLETFHKMGALFWAITDREVLHESVSR